MIKTMKEAKSLSSSSAFIIIIVLVVVSVAAIVVGGGDGFSRKYAGIDFREFSGKMLLAQTGVVGKILEFEEEGDEFTLNLLPIELDGSLLDSGEKYTTTIVPPREGDTPFSYRPEEGLQVTQGYPLLREYVEENNLDATVSDNGNDELPAIPGVIDCSANTVGGGFSVFFEDIAYDTNVGFDDPETGVSRQTEICSVMHEFESMLLLDELNLNPSIVVQSSVEGTPDHTLSVVSPQYVGGSGFVSTLLADYLRSGLKRSNTSFTENVSVLGVNSGFMRFNFKDGTNWSADTGNSADYDMKTVTRQNMLRLLGFGSFLGHEQENVLSSSWKRWTEWDRLLFADNNNLIEPGTLQVSSIDYNDFNPGDADEYDERLTNVSSPVEITASNAIPDIFNIPGIQGVNYDLATYSNFQKGQSISGLADPNAVSYPIIEAGESKTVTQAEKEILCMLGLAVEGVEGCEETPRTVSQDIYIERQNNKPVCINIDQGLYNAATSEFFIEGEISEPTNASFSLYDEPCPSTDFVNVNDQLAFYESAGTTDYAEARSFSWSPNQSESLYREYVQFSYQVKDNLTGRVSDPRTVAIHKCVITANSNQLCNGDFQFSGATSPVDYKLSSLEDDFDNDGDPIVGCESTTMPGWCAQGVQDGFSSEFGYTWHPYLIDNPKAFDSEIVTSPRRYAGGSTGAIVQRLRVPLSANTPYLVSGRVFVTQDGLQPTFWYGSQNSILRQPDGTYHIDYPEALAPADGSISTEFILTKPLTSGEWHTFSWTLNPGNQNVTHIAFGGSNNNGFVLYDDLSIQHISDCGDCFSDSTGDCVTNTNDLLIFLSQFSGECPNDSIGCTGDATLDGVVNTSDMLLFLTSYGNICQPVIEDIVENEDEEDSGTSGGTSSGGGSGSGNEYCDPREGTECWDSGTGLGIIPSAQQQQSSSKAIVIADKKIIDDLEIDIQLLEGEEIIPNSKGFAANLVLIIKNLTNQNIEDANIIGALPSMMVYDSHVATEENVAYDNGSNTLLIPEIGREKTVYVYFNVDISSNICAQIERETDDAAYTLLTELNLCDSYQQSVSKVYNLRQTTSTTTKDGITTTKTSVKSAGSGDSGMNGSASGSGGSGSGSGNLQSPGSSYQCYDGIDNDNDGRTDYPADTDCSSAGDTSEGVATQCADGIDNNSNGRTDYPSDTGCTSASDISEGTAGQCNDGVDNDSNGKTDYPADPGCTGYGDTTEGSATPQCSDGIDNDGDTRTDYPGDPQCSSAADNSESS